MRSIIFGKRKKVIRKIKKKQRKKGNPKREKRNKYFC